MNPLTPERIEEIEQRAKNATRGPWGWRGQPSHGGQIRLVTLHSGQEYVMAFGRLGMHGAQPRFQADGLMYNASDLCTFQVGESGVVGMEAAKANKSVYRYDIDDILHPDAQLIAHAPTDIADLLAECRRLHAELVERDGRIAVLTSLLPYEEPPLVYAAYHGWGDGETARAGETADVQPTSETSASEVINE